MCTCVCVCVSMTGNSRRQLRGFFWFCRWIFALCVLKPLISFNTINVNLIYRLPTYWLHTHAHTHVMKSCDWYDPREGSGAHRWVSVRKQCCWSQRSRFPEFREECSAVPDVMAQTVETIPRPQLVQSWMALNTLYSSCTDVFPLHLTF